MRSRIALMVLCGVTTATSAGATTLSVIDDTLSPGNAIEYTLSFNFDGVSEYNAVFTIESATDRSPEWYGGWFTFKLDGSTGATLSNLVAPTGTWSILNPGDTVDVLWAGGNMKGLKTNGGKTGFYLHPLEDTTYQSSVLLTGGTTTTFTFDFTVPGSVNDDVVPFKVGYYDGVLPSGNVKFSQLSTALVPEPSSAVLFAAGSLLVGFAIRPPRRLHDR